MGGRDAITVGQQTRSVPSAFPLTLSRARVRRTTIPPRRERTSVPACAGRRISSPTRTDAVTVRRRVLSRQSCRASMDVPSRQAPRCRAAARAETVRKHGRSGSRQGSCSASDHRTTMGRPRSIVVVQSSLRPMIESSAATEPGSLYRPARRCSRWALSRAAPGPGR
jgi:hypothetical protein